MSWTTSIIVNAVPSVLVVALFRLMWFGVSARYDEPGARSGREFRQEALEDERSQRAA